MQEIRPLPAASLRRLGTFPVVVVVVVAAVLSLFSFTEDTLFIFTLVSGTKEADLSPAVTGCIISFGVPQNSGGKEDPPVFT